MALQPDVGGELAAVPVQTRFLINHHMRLSYSVCSEQHLEHLNAVALQPDVGGELAAFPVQAAHHGCHAGLAVAEAQGVRHISTCMRVLDQLPGF